MMHVQQSIMFPADMFLILRAFEKLREATIKIRHCSLCFWPSIRLEQLGFTLDGFS
jgi:hypothetical protein